MISLRTSTLAALAALALGACYLEDDYSGGLPGGPGQAGAGAGGASGSSGQAGAGAGGASGSSGQGGGSAGKAGAPATPCEQVARAHCERLAAQCALSDAARGADGKALCEGRAEQVCERTRALPGVSAGDAELLGCASRLKTLPDLGCEEGIDPLSACLLRGARAEGEACAAGAQSEGGGCLVVQGGCGFCFQRVAEGEACDGPGILAGCEAGTSCQGGLCAPRQPGGEPCNSLLDCLAGATCDSGQCKPMQTKEGDPCSGDSPCAPQSALHCEQQLCAPTEFKKVGELCDEKASAAQQQCAPGAWCKPGLLGTAVCNPFTPDGGACEGDAGCAPPARCVEKVCALLQCADASGAGGQGGAGGGMAP